jgi:hypothetical protein
MSLDRIGHASKISGITLRPSRLRAWVTPLAAGLP